MIQSDDALWMRYHSIVHPNGQIYLNELDSFDDTWMIDNIHRLHNLLNLNKDMSLVKMHHQT